MGDSPKAEQPVAVVFVAGTHHADGVDEAAFDQEGANLLLLLLQVDVDGTEWQLPLKAEPIWLLREDGQGRGVQDQEPVPLFLRGQVLQFDPRGTDGATRWLVP